MKALEEKILKEGVVLEGNVLKVGNFLNQKIDTAFTVEMAKEVKRLFADEKITKIFTIEASGIAIGLAVALEFGVPLVFAKKSKASNQSGELLTATIHSYTRGIDYTATVAAEYIEADDHVLIVDDFLANGGALCGLVEIVRAAGASLAGCVVQIEKGFQGGGDELRKQGIRVESLANIEKMSVTEGITFRT